MITAAQLKAAFPVCRDPTLWVSLLPKVAEEFELNTQPRLLMWLAQCGHESSQFNMLRENLSYSMLGLMKTWPSHFPTEASAQPFTRQPERLANFVYGGRLGNGDAASGDGWRFRGGGLIDTTGRENYRLTGQGINVPLEQQPAKIEDRLVAARAAGWYWKTRGCNELADAGKFEEITKVVNGKAELGLKERIAFLQKLIQVTGDTRQVA